MEWCKEEDEEEEEEIMRRRGQRRRRGEAKQGLWGEDIVVNKAEGE